MATIAVMTGGLVLVIVVLLIWLNRGASRTRNLETTRRLLEVRHDRIRQPLYGSIGRPWVDL